MMSEYPESRYPGRSRHNPVTDLSTNRRFGLRHFGPGPRRRRNAWASTQRVAVQGPTAGAVSCSQGVSGVRT